LRRTRPYITNVLSRNEAFRNETSCRKLFLRIARGFYLPNPRMEIEAGEQWRNTYDVVNLDALEREKDDQNLQNLAAYIRKYKALPLDAPEG
jgi:hypothetical protein